MVVTEFDAGKLSSNHSPLALIEMSSVEVGTQYEPNRVIAGVLLGSDLTARYLTSPLTISAINDLVFIEYYGLL